MAVLTTEVTKKALHGKAKQPKNLDNDGWDDMDERAFLSIQSALSANIL